jgi:hypothetical protein
MRKLVWSLGDIVLRIVLRPFENGPNAPTIREVHPFG